MSARWVFSWGMSIVFAMLSNMGCSNRPVVVRIIDGQTVQGRFVHPEAYALVMEGQLAEQRGWLAQAERLYLAALRYQPNDASILVRLGALRCAWNQQTVPAAQKTFADALKVAGREDPDIILVGEMRDTATISLALTCAELGILVFGTLHTNSAAKTIDRIINAFPADQQEQTRTMLAESLSAVVAQQLLKTRDGKGRCAAIEILLGSSALATTIREGKISQINSLIQTGSNIGMQNMDQHLLQLIKEDKITARAAYEKALDKKLFEKMIDQESQT